MTHLRQAMLDELQRRNYATTTVQVPTSKPSSGSRSISTARLTSSISTHLREYQAYLLRDRKLEPRTVKLHVSALRFFFVKTLRRRYLLDDIPYPKVPRRLPTILTVEEVTRLIDAARTLTDRTMLMVLYSTGMRNAEMRSLQVQEHRQSVDADSHRARQRRSRSVRPAQSDAAGDPARVLALDEAEDVAVSGHDRGLARRQTDHAEGGVGCLSIGGDGAPSLRSGSRRTSCGIRTRPISWRPVRTCARSSCCSGTSSSNTP